MVAPKLCFVGLLRTEARYLTVPLPPPLPPAATSACCTRRCKARGEREREKLLVALARAEVALQTATDAKAAARQQVRGHGA